MDRTTAVKVIPLEFFDCRPEYPFIIERWYIAGETYNRKYSSGGTLIEWYQSNDHDDHFSKTKVIEDFLESCRDGFINNVLIWEKIKKI